MIVVRVEVWPMGDEAAKQTTHVLTIDNMGPTAEGEPWDSGGERQYGVSLVGVGGAVVVAHRRSDGLLALVGKAAAALT